MESKRHFLMSDFLVLDSCGRVGTFVCFYCYPSLQWIDLPLVSVLVTQEELKP